MDKISSVLAVLVIVMWPAMLISLVNLFGQVLIPITLGTYSIAALGTLIFAYLVSKLDVL